MCEDLTILSSLSSEFLIIFLRVFRSLVLSSLTTGNNFLESINFRFTPLDKCPNQINASLHQAHHDEPFHLRNFTSFRPALLLHVRAFSHNHAHVPANGGAMRSDEEGQP